MVESLSPPGRVCPGDDPVSRARSAVEILGEVQIRVFAVQLVGPALVPASYLDYNEAMILGPGDAGALRGGERERCAVYTLRDCPGR